MWIECFKMKFIFIIVLDLQKNHEDSFLIPPAQFPLLLINIIHWHSTFITINEAVLICYY